MDQIPERFPATGAETAISITRAVTCQRIGLRLDFEPGTLSVPLLARAVRLTLDAEPLLGCAFRTDARRAYWSRLDLPTQANCFRAVDSADPDEDMNAFQAAEVPDGGPQAAVVLLQTPVADHLGIKLSHVLTDGQGAKQYAYLLAKVYSHLEADESYLPRPNLRTRPTGKDVWATLSREQRREASKAKSWVNPTWVIPSSGSSGGGLTYATSFLEPDAFRAVKRYGRERGATINDMMLTAVFRTCVNLFDPPSGMPLSLMCTADLRRYLPNADTLPLVNVSISGSLDIDRVDGEPFDQTLARVRAGMASWERQCYGAGPLANAERLTALGYGLTKWLMGLAFRGAGKSGKTYPWFTNIGVLDDARLRFGGVAPIAGQMYGPASRGGAIVPVVSTYRDRLAIAMGFCSDDTEAALIEDFLGKLIRELDVAHQGWPGRSRAAV